jgi:hypothetical protein
MMKMCMIMKYRKKYKDIRNYKQILKVLIGTNKEAHTHNTHKCDPQVEV